VSAGEEEEAALKTQEAHSPRTNKRIKVCIGFLRGGVGQSPGRKSSGIRIKGWWGRRISRKRLVRTQEKRKGGKGSHGAFGTRKHAALHLE